MMNPRVLIMALALVGLLSFTACEPTEEPTPKSIVELAQETDNLSTLVAALQQTNLVAELEKTGPFTVFAPTNDAFQSLLDSNPNWNSLTDIDNDILSEVLLFHVFGGEVMESDLTDTYIKSLTRGPNDEFVDLQVQVTGGVNFNGKAAPVETDIEASNGVIHIINQVMLPPNVVEKAQNNSEFSSLVAALTRSDLQTDFVGLLTGDGPFTVFAPTNAAFQALLDSNNEWNTLADIPLATLEAVLKYHVVNGANVQSDELQNEQEVAAVEGKFTIDLTDGARITTSSGQSVEIVITDVQAINGVVHAVNQVLL
ncbi:MAG: fasciclin domain-containing protein, partial [Bacteroidota bacterium]